MGRDPYPGIFGRYDRRLKIANPQGGRSLDRGSDSSSNATWKGKAAYKVTVGQGVSWEVFSNWT